MDRDELELPIQPVDVEALARDVREYYRKPGNATGGNLHIALEDGNVGSDDLVYVFGECEGEGDTEGAELVLRLMDLSVVERDWFHHRFHLFYSD